MHFELGEMRTGNAIGDYDTEADALAVVRDTAAAHGRDAIQTFALVRINRRGRATTLATGSELVDRAHSAAPRGTAVPV